MIPGVTPRAHCITGGVLADALLGMANALPS